DGDRNVQVLVDVRLATHELQRDARAVLFRRDDHVGLSPLLVRHAGAKPRDLPRIANALVYEPPVDGDHRYERHEEDGNADRISEAEVAPALAAAFNLLGHLRGVIVNRSRIGTPTRSLRPVRT